jgi:flavin-dependent dehydrogenase
VLASLGVWDQFLAEKNSPSLGIHSAWGRPDLYANDFIFNPYGRGWHLNRARFDAMLARASKKAGAVVLHGARFIECTDKGASQWLVRTSGGGAQQSLHAKFLVDASGRGSVLAREKGAVRVSYDRLIAAVAFLPSNSGASIPLDDTLIEATEIGWWYSAVLPDSQVVVAFMTDADVYARAARGSPRFSHEQLRRSTHTRCRVAPSVGALVPHLVAANSSRLQPVAGTNWLAVGDAAAAFDPLSSQGIYKALESGLRAGQVISDYFAGNNKALEEYARGLDSAFNKYLSQRSSYYRNETRWPSSLFWRRRHSAQSESPAR